MNTFICAGGSGLRVLEALLHLCAAGLGPPSMRILGIDPDGSNGNATRVKETLKKYLQCHQNFAGKLGTDLNLFGTKLDLFDTRGGEQELNIWTPVLTGNKLAELLNYDNLSATETSPDVVRLFFTNDELQMALDQGFSGHAVIGAAAMSLVSLQANRQPWKQVVERLRVDISQPQGARVFLVGSVFGGTGASAIYPVARFLCAIPDINKDRLKIGVAALVPYFSFGAAESDKRAEAESDKRAEMAAKSERFPIATRSAVEFYQHLRENEDWPFDAMFWIGDNSPMEVSYAPGGPNQKNPAHFVDLLAALSCIEFFEEPVTTRACYYSGPRQDVSPPPKESNLLDWPDLPLNRLIRDHVRTKLLQFFIAGVAHLGFCDALLRREDINRRPFCVPWYLERFALQRDWFDSQENQDALDLLTQFFKDYHFPWWAQIHRKDTVRLFNCVAIRNDDGSIGVKLNRLANLLWPDKSGEASLDHFDRFFTDMVQVPKSKGGEKGVPAYLAILAHAADRFIKREYKKTES